MKNNVIITGISGQDGALLAKYLLKKKIFNIYGICKKKSFKSLVALNYFQITKFINFIFIDLQDHKKIENLIKKIKPKYFFNFAGVSSASFNSFKNPGNTDYINNACVIYILDAISRYSPKTRFLQAGSSEIFGNFKNFSNQKINENTKFNPDSPYAISKLSSYFYTKMYRDKNKIFASNAIFFNHESPFRGNEYVTKKIIKGLVSFKKYGQHFYLGNLYSKRDWGDAEEYVRIAFKIISYHRPDDYVICSGISYSIKDFVNIACKYLRIPIKWTGSGLNEKAVSLKNKTIIMVKKNLFRNHDINYLKSDCSKAKKDLGWRPKKINKLIKKMIDYELNFSDY
jgi:GDPmannose 4,6-dehydratase